VKRKTTRIKTARRSLPRCPWPWDDRGRSAVALDIETLKRQAHEASLLYSQAMR
jgi:hypothetical protein